jgi:hypothetical protein
VYVYIYIYIYIYIWGRNFYQTFGNCVVSVLCLCSWLASRRCYGRGTVLLWAGYCVVMGWVLCCGRGTVLLAICSRYVVQIGRRKEPAVQCVGDGSTAVAALYSKHPPSCLTGWYPWRTGIWVTCLSKSSRTLFFNSVYSKLRLPGLVGKCIFPNSRNPE